ncbi:MAG: hypothetical protein ACREQ5_08370 [Candidatus Dormibacteria bacterium]
MQQIYVLDKSQSREVVKANLHAFIDRLPTTQVWRIEVKFHRKERTHAQNSALFGLAYPVLACATGFTPDELHEAFCKRFFGSVVRVVLGEKVSRAYRTTTKNERGETDVLNTATFSDFYTMVQFVAAEAGIDVPDPNPLHGVGA